MLYGAADLWHSRFVSTPGKALASLQKMGFSANGAMSAQRLVDSRAFWYLSESFVFELSASSPWLDFIVRAHCDPMRSKMLAGSLEQSGRERFQRILGGVRASDVCPAGIDFHVWPTIFDDLLASFDLSPDPEQRVVGFQLRLLSEKARKEAMWHCSSGLNYRKFLSSGVAESALPHQSALNRGIWEKFAPAHRAAVQRRLTRYNFAIPPPQSEIES
jgi:hypothetical protein